MDVTTCPECGAPAEVTDRSALESTDGPIEHVKIQCLRRHWFLMPAGSLDEQIQATRPSYTGTVGCEPAVINVSRIATPLT
jgi:hypothetical protein